ncbi:hypothetical protein ACFY3U_02680 [Micromonospora sp. NPDC000089]|uniref:hypothetical protein n=1 Tax=unclassified Micromonospora TaxID=2617518 RepID=UPI00368E6B41
MTSSTRRALAALSAAPLLALLGACGGAATPAGDPVPVATDIPAATTAPPTPRAAAGASAAPAATVGLGSRSPSRSAAPRTAAVPRNAGGTVRLVGPGHPYRTPCAAIAAASAGDTVQIDARGNGTYDGDVCGSPTLVTQAGATLVATCADPTFVNRSGYDYHLRPGSACVDAGRTPPAGLTPTGQYVHPVRSGSRAVRGAAIDARAFES